MIWDIYDGPRTGITDYKSQPCHFTCKLDPEGGYSEQFELAPIKNDLLKLAKEQWAIYQDWEMKFHSEKVEANTHPGNKGINFRYEQLEEMIQLQIKSLHKIRCLFSGKFRALPNQEELPVGVLRELEVEWEVYSPNQPLNTMPKSGAP